MPTKIVIRNNGSIRVEGDFELSDQDGNKFDLGGSHGDFALSLWAEQRQAVLRQHT